MKIFSTYLPFSLKSIISGMLLALLLMHFQSTRAELKKDTEPRKAELKGEAVIENWQADEEYIGWHLPDSLRKNRSLADKLNKKDSGDPVGTLLESDAFKYISFILILLVALYFAFSQEVNSIFLGRNFSLPDGHRDPGSEEDLEKMDLDKMLRQALENKNYRMAIRIWYLRILQELNRRQMINWHPEKTNQDYVNELSSRKEGAAFRGITRVYNWVWYGEARVGEEDFSRYRQEFQAFLDNAGRA